MLGQNAQCAQASDVTTVVATIAAAPPFEVRMQGVDVANARGGAIPPVEIFVAAAIALCQLRGRAFGVRDGRLCRASAGRKYKKGKRAGKDRAHSPADAPYSGEGYILAAYPFHSLVKCIVVVVSSQSLKLSEMG